MERAMKEIKKEIVNTAKMGVVDKSATCAYRRYGKRYCAITTHETCNRCRFYEPSAVATYEIALDMVKHGGLITETVNKEFAELENVSKQMHTAGLHYISKRIDTAIKNIREVE